MKKTPPELTALRAALREAVRLRLDAAHARNDHTATSASELQSELDQARQAGVVHRARIAAERAGVKVSADTDRLALTYTKGHLRTTDGRKVWTSSKYPNVCWVEVPKGSVFDKETGVYV